MSKIIKGAAVEKNPFVLQIKSTLKKINTEEKAYLEEKLNAQIEEANRQAAETIEKARREAEKLLEQAEQEAEELKAKAQQQGYQDGLQQAAGEAEKIRRQAREVLQQAEEIRRQTLEQMEQEILNLAVEIAEKFVAAQLKLDPEMTVEVAKEAVQLVKDREQVIIYVNPGEVNIYMQKKEELKQALPEHTALNIIADPQVKPGGCLINTEQGMVDATADSRWQEIIKAVFPA